jgi:glycosyltransferase involved in cell wall biosynthesis
MKLKLNHPLLSVVIPTKNRYETLFPIVKAILGNIIDDRIELIIQDNSDDPVQAKIFFAEYCDLRIKYDHIDGNLSIVDNTEIGLSRANGEYITFIGDDDLISPNIIDYVENFFKDGVLAVIYPPAYYWWNDVKFFKPNYYNQPGAFWYPKSVNDEIKRIDSKKEYIKVLEQGGAGIFDLPRIYHGIVHKSILTRIKEIDGRYVYGASPDMALAFSTALVIQSYIKINTPLTIYGASKNSGGGYTASKTHFGKISEQKHLPKKTKDGWSKELPPIWSEHTIYPQTITEVIGIFKSTKKINFTAFYASMMINEPHLRQIVLPYVFNYFKKNPKEIIKFIKTLIKKFLGRLYRLFKEKVYGFPFKMTVINSPEECIKFIKKFENR